MSHFNCHFNSLLHPPPPFFFIFSLSESNKGLVCGEGRGRDSRNNTPQCGLKLGNPRFYGEGEEVILAVSGSAALYCGFGVATISRRVTVFIYLLRAFLFLISVGTKTGTSLKVRDKGRETCSVCAAEVRPTKLRCQGLALLLRLKGVGLCRPL